jgi:hypothetical protein
MNLPRDPSNSPFIFALAAAGASWLWRLESPTQWFNASGSPTPSAIRVSVAPAIMRQLPGSRQQQPGPNQQTDVAAETSGKSWLSALTWAVRCDADR